MLIEEHISFEFMEERRFAAFMRQFFQMDNSDSDIELTFDHVEQEMMKALLSPPRVGDAVLKMSEEQKATAKSLLLAAGATIVDATTVDSMFEGSLDLLSGVLGKDGFGDIADTEPEELSNDIPLDTWPESGTRDSPIDLTVEEEIVIRHPKRVRSGAFVGEKKKQRVAKASKT